MNNKNRNHFQNLSTHKNLEAWILSVELCANIHRLTAEFPSDDRFWITGQMRKCALSIPSNIAEGAARGSRKEFIRFLRIAAGSASELDTQLVVAIRIGLLDQDRATEITKVINSVRRLIQGLLRSLQRK